MPAAAALLRNQPELRARLAGSDMLSRLKSRLQQVTIGDETLWVAEGDLLLDEDQLGIYALQQENLEQEKALRRERAALGAAGLPAPQALVGVTQNGKLVRWKDGLILTYCVLKQTFSAEHYELVSRNMKQAVGAWEQVCGIKFQHEERLDNSNPGSAPAGVVFTVREIDAGGRFIASAFFPNDPRNRRRVLIDPSYYNTDLSFDRVGVLRHELGHVLGFRHEHIRSDAPAMCPHEDLDNTLDLTQYDPQSVMHYFCGGVGSRELAITEIDKTGAQKLYGPPLDMYQFVE
jgi:hypothetical protein